MLHRLRSLHSVGARAVGQEVRSAPQSSSSSPERERGSAAIEFLLGGVLLLIPLLYLIVALSQLHGASLATEGAARQAARVYVTANTPAQAQSRAEAAVVLALADYGISPHDAKISISCQPAGRCLTPGALVTVQVEVMVQLPVLDLFLPAQHSSVAVEAQASQQVSRFHRGGG